MKYAKYDQKTIYLVSKTKNPNLFPELNIPRSTAKYWIRSKQHLKLRIQKEVASSRDNVLKSENKELKNEKRRLKKELHIIKSYISILNKNNLIKSTSDSSTRFQIIQVIRNNRGRNSIRKVLKSLKISFSTYKRWAKDDPSIHPHTKYIQKTCRSLTASEVSDLQKLYMNKSLFFYPLHALSTKAKRDELLYVSPRTWQKYIKIFKLHRPVLLKKTKKEYLIGIRANTPHEIWHIDITQFNVNKKKMYMQAIVDNYSRSVLFSHFSQSISGDNTMRVIHEAVKKFGPPNKLMSDGGKENINYKIQSLLETLKVKHIIAKVNTRFSNSIIEVFFRTMKSNYLNHLKIKCNSELIRKIDFYIENYNYEIPHSALNFRTPDEVLRDIPPEHYPNLFKTFQKKTQDQRIKEFKEE